MKKILIVSDSLRVGGIQSSLINFIKEISKENYQITLFLFNDSDKHKLQQENINIISGTKMLKIISYSSEEARKKGTIIFIIRKCLALLCKLFTSNFVYSLIFLFEKKLYDYDVAISFSNNISNRAVYFGYNKFVLEKVKSKYKISYLHADYETIRTDFFDKEYRKFDRIWFVSDFVKKTFLKYNEMCSSKCDVVYNFINTDKMRKEKKNPFNNKKFHIVTIGRLDQNKSQIDSIEIASQLLKNKVDFEWYLIGEGPEKERIEETIKLNDLEEYIYLTGNKDNVEDYLYYSDVFVSLSKSESYGLAIAESLLLKNITIVKNIPVIKEFISDNGIICDDNEEIAKTLIKLINDSNYYKECKKKSK